MPLAKQEAEEESLGHRAGRSDCESRPCFLPSSYGVIAKTKFLKNVLSILIFRQAVSGIKISYTKSSVTAVKGKFLKYENHMNFCIIGSDQEKIILCQMYARGRDKSS